MTVFEVTSDQQDEATLATSVRSGEGRPPLVVLKRKDGEDFLSEVLGKNILVDRRKLVLGLIRDVTSRERYREERRTLDRQLQQTQKLKSLGVLAGGISHISTICSWRSEATLSSRSRSCVASLQS
jgi:hypothetical protein